MSAPHADRDASEQPTACECGGGHLGGDGLCECACHDPIPTQVWPPRQRRDAEQREKPCGGCAECGTSRAEPVRASEAQVAAAKVAIEAGFTKWLRNVFSVTEDPSHRKTALEVVDCIDSLAYAGEAKAVADAVVAAGEDADEVTRQQRAAAEAALANAARATKAEAVVDRLTDLASAESERRIKAEAEVERLRRERDGIGCSRFTCADDLGRTRYRAEAAEAERDRLAETVARVEALADEWERTRGGLWGAAHVMELRAALSGPSPATTPGTPHTPAGAPEGTSGQSGTGEALGGAQGGWWRARCDVPGCGWLSLPSRQRAGADQAGFVHWEGAGHGTSVGRADR